MSRHRLLHGADLHDAKAHLGIGSPLGILTPDVIGLVYFDTSTNSLWVSTGLTNLDWTPFGGGFSTLPAFLQSLVKAAPGRHLLGSGILDYPNDGIAVDGIVQYAQVWLPGGLPLTTAETFQVANGALGRNIRLGVYNQAVPLSQAGTPNSRVAQTGVTSTNGADGTYLSAPLLVPYTVPIDGFHWVAFITDNALVQFAASDVMRANEPRVFRETSVGTTLPAVAGVLTNPLSAIVYAAAVE